MKLVDLDLETFRPAGLDRLPSGKWRARVVIGGQQVTIGYYDHPVYAAHARDEVLWHVLGRRTPEQFNDKLAGYSDDDPPDKSPRTEALMKQFPDGTTGARFPRKPRREVLFEALLSGMLAGPFASDLLYSDTRARELARLLDIAAEAAAAESARYCGAPVDPDKNPDTVSQPSSS